MHFRLQGSINGHAPMTGTFYRPFTCGTLLVLVMSGLLYAVQLFVFFAINLSLKGTPRTVLDFTYYAFFVLLPVTGWVAES